MRSLDRLEAYVSLLFSGARLAVSGIALFVAAVAVSDRHTPRSFAAAAAVLVLVMMSGDVLLIREIGRAVRTDTSHVALTVADAVRAWSMWMRCPATLAYAATAGLMFFVSGGVFADRQVTSQWSVVHVVAVGFALTLVLSYGANLALLAAMSAVRLPRRLVVAAFDHRLWIDLTAAVLVSIAAGGRVGL